jgi:hypothetical protein
MKMPKFLVTLTRLVEQEAQVYVDALSADRARVHALKEGVAEAIWHDSDTEPHTYTAEAELR